MRTPHRQRVLGIMSRACAAPPPALCPHPLVSICHLSETGLFQIYGAAQVVTALARPRGYVTGIVAHIGIQTITLLRNLDGQQSFSILTSHIIQKEMHPYFTWAPSRDFTLQNLKTVPCILPGAFNQRKLHSIFITVSMLKLRNSPLSISALGDFTAFPNLN